MEFNWNILHELNTEMVRNKKLPLKSVFKLNKHKNKRNCQYRPYTGVYMDVYTWKLTNVRLFWGPN